MSENSDGAKYEDCYEALKEQTERLVRAEEALSYVAGFVGLNPDHRVRQVAREALSDA